MVGNKKALVDGKRVNLDVPPTIIKGRTMVPIRFISENLGAKVDWNETTQTVSVNYQAK